MTFLPHRFGFRLASLLTAGSLAAAGLTACAPAPPGPYQQQAGNAAYACQQGIQQACYDYQAVAPAANAEAYDQQQQAQVGTAVAAGLVGAVAGAAIISSTRSNRGHYRGGRGYYRGDRGYDRHRGYDRRGYDRRGYDRRGY